MLDALYQIHDRGPINLCSKNPGWVPSLTEGMGVGGLYKWEWRLLGGAHCRLGSH